MNKGIIFDLDGTLWDVTKSTYESALFVSRKYGTKDVDIKDVCNSFGATLEESAVAYFRDVPKENALKMIKEVADKNISYLKEHGGIVYKNVEETILKLSQKYKLFIVSNSSFNSYIESFLDNSTIKNKFTAYIAAGQFGLTKSEAIKKVIRDNNLSHAVYVGDTIKDKVASREAGVIFIHALYGYGKSDNDEISIRDISELPLLMETIETINKESVDEL